MTQADSSAYFFVTPEAATKMAQRASDEAFNHLRPAHLYENGWRYLESAQWLVEHELRGTHSLLDTEQPAKLYQRGIQDITLSVEKSEDQQTYHKYINVLMAHRALRWLCFERGSKGAALENLQDAYLQDIATSLTLRHERSQQEEIDSKTTEKRKTTIRGDYGFLLEAMLLGVVAESEAFRRARIVGLPASPTHEMGSELLQRPPDIMLWRVQDDQTTIPIGGIQAKSKRKVGTSDPLNFTATFFARTEFDNRTNKEIISNWIEGKELELTHYRLERAILRSGNLALVEALGIEPYSYSPEPSNSLV